MAAAPAAPVAVVDALNALLEAEQNSIFRFMGEGSPYLSRATVEIRRPLQQMMDTSYRHCGQLYALIEHLGGDPRPRGLQPEEQYLAFLSLKFLLPKLVDAKKLTIRRYENTLKSVENSPDEVTEMLRRHIAEHRDELKVLERATEQVLAGK
jgi:bacterioferritin (cytochrome b1)